MYSIFDIFSIGIGPSSSHTVGPMKAASRFIDLFKCTSNCNDAIKIKITLYGSLAYTGKGHGTDTALVYGLLGFEPSSIDIEKARLAVQSIKNTNILSLEGLPDINFSFEQDIIFNKQQTFSEHSNGMVFEVVNAKNSSLLKRTFFSIGGGFIIEDKEDRAENKSTVNGKHSFSNFAELKTICDKNEVSIAHIILENELAHTLASDIESKCQNLWSVMNNCIKRGTQTSGILPGGLKLERRAKILFESLITSKTNDPLDIIDWLNTFALAVSEENAAGNQVVTAPTNGAAGIIPAVLAYINHFETPLTHKSITEFFAVASAIGSLYKMNGSISGAEVGCQGETGVACSMAAGALTHLWGGNTAQVEIAAEIAMEHHLGLTCDPVGGLVQIPCIERNAISAVKAINAARMAIKSTNLPKVSLDKVIKTMYQTGNDMNDKYKETSRGGLAINIHMVEC